MFSVDVESGLVLEARQLPSPNCDERPENCGPELIIIHGISLPPGEFEGQWIDQLFTNCLDPSAHPYFEEIKDLRVSSHFLIRRDGELVQYVSLHKRAWHAGESCYQDRQNCNDYSIGIELEGEDAVPYAEFQYEKLIMLIDALRNSLHTLRDAPVVGHNEVAPGRKTDPGDAFDWSRIRSVYASANES
jgi:AmpD protein